jgi:hypothetical protein
VIVENRDFIDLHEPLQKLNLDGKSPFIVSVDELLQSLIVWTDL